MKTYIVSAALFFAACGAPDTNADGELTDAELGPLGKADAVLPAPATSAHLYFDQPVVDSAGVGVLSYRTFSARGSQSFTVEVDGLDSNGKLDTRNGSVGYKLSRLTRVKGKLVWRLVDVVDGRRGVASKSFHSYYSRKYLVEIAGGSSPSAQSVLTCNSGDHADCAVVAQPGDFCGLDRRHGTVACDDGLYCQYGPSCGFADDAGVCTAMPQFCTQLYKPVCGCDGNTYGNACDAASRGVSAASTGACACDPNKWVGGLSGDAASTWEFIASSGSHFQYQIADDNTFNALTEPGCVYANPRCYVKLAPRPGTWAWDGDTLVLTYDLDGTKVRLASSHTCAGGERLVGRDAGTSLTLTRLPTP